LDYPELARVTSPPLLPSRSLFSARRLPLLDQDGLEPNVQLQQPLPSPGWHQRGVRSAPHRIAEELRAGKVDEVIVRLKRMPPNSAESREKLESLIRHYSNDASRMQYDKYLWTWMPIMRKPFGQALDLPADRFDRQAMLQDTLAALNQLPQLTTQFRQKLPQRSLPTLAQLEERVRVYLFLPAFISVLFFSAFRSPRPRVSASSVSSVPSAPSLPHPSNR
jgi:hypothetical protein